MTAHCCSFSISSREPARRKSKSVFQLGFQAGAHLIALQGQFQAEAELGVLDLHVAKVGARGPRGQVALFDQQRAHPAPGQVVGRGAANQAAAHDHHVPALACHQAPSSARPPRGTGTMGGRGVDCPTASTGWSSSRASSSATELPHMRPWQRPIPARVSMRMALTVVRPLGDRPADLAHGDLLAAAQHRVVGQQARPGARRSEKGRPVRRQSAAGGPGPAALRRSWPADHVPAQRSGGAQRGQPSFQPGDVFAADARAIPGDNRARPASSAATRRAPERRPAAPAGSGARSQPGARAGRPA